MKMFQLKTSFQESVCIELEGDTLVISYPNVIISIFVDNFLFLPHRLGPFMHFFPHFILTPKLSFYGERSYLEC